MGEAHRSLTHGISDEGARFFDRLEGDCHSPSRLEELKLLARLGFSGFLASTEALALMKTELRVRREEVGCYRSSDRTARGLPDAVQDGCGRGAQRFGRDDPERSY
ncbi:hypothetical protein [Kineococcus sp. SYSU DK001]|uniref:hypothetical protein n=1 Tax=Kineococcus sp. SYSU DK001 TaxID=3383122 RepID=UPI003D7DC6E1